MSFLTPVLSKHSRDAARIRVTLPPQVLSHKTRGRYLMAFGQQLVLCALVCKMKDRDYPELLLLRKSILNLFFHSLVVTLHPPPLFDLISPHSPRYLWGSSRTSLLWTPQICQVHCHVETQALVSSSWHLLSLQLRSVLLVNLKGQHELRRYLLAETPATLVKCLHCLHPVTAFFLTFVLSKGSFLRLGTLCLTPVFSSIHNCVVTD